MAVRRSRPGRWTIDITTESIDTTCGIPTVDSGWVGTDSHGHEHRGSNLSATTVEVIDEQHWCDGTEGIAPHDPHMAIDASHLECQECGDVIEPRILPPFTPQSAPGPTRIEMTGTRYDLEWPVESWQVVPGSQEEAETIIGAVRELVSDTAALDAWCDEWMDAHRGHALRLSASING